MNASRLDVLQRGEDKRIILGSSTSNEGRFCTGVFRLWTVCKEHKNSVLTKEQNNKQNQEQKHEARETPHPIESIIVIRVRIAADSSTDCAVDCLRT